MEELAQFSSYSSRMAALDFIICDGSNVFVTNNNGNMARILAVRTFQKGFMGEPGELKPGRVNGSIWAFEEDQNPSRQMLVGVNGSTSSFHEFFIINEE
ncbi:hypothetical protein Cni_G07137 [Canna indica]|uniref:Uncharacterized protein n=1 Tax=Canna indica TaxID=4628 RepID=A0AAQ3Q6M1_9LILI|nr:hypothetical protein Cni_G07137 [Canna indica]